MAEYGFAKTDFGRPGTLGAELPYATRDLNRSQTVRPVLLERFERSSNVTAPLESAKPLEFATTSIRSLTKRSLSDRELPLSHMHFNYPTAVYLSWMTTCSIPPVR